MEHIDTNKELGVQRKGGNLAASFKTTINFIIEHKTFLSAVGAILLALGGFVAWIYHVAFDNGYARMEKESIIISDKARTLENKAQRLQKDSEIKTDKIGILEDSIKILKGVISYIKDLKIPSTQEVTRRKSLVEVTPYQILQPPLQPPTVKLEYEKRVKDAQDRINFLETYCLSLTGENDDLKGKLSSMRLQLQRAINYEVLRKTDVDDVAKSIHEKLRDDVLSKIEGQMASIVPALPMTNPGSKQPTTTTVTVLTINHEVLGDSDFDTATQQDQILRNQPDRIRGKRNKTKKDFVRPILLLYQSALLHYNQANSTKKVQKTRDMITQFSHYFKIGVD